MWKKILTDDSGLVTGIFFQDSPMKRFFDKYPELLLLVATYKLTNTHMPLHVMLCVGPNGESEIVPQFFKDLTAAIGCMRHEREQALLTATDKVCVRGYAADSLQAQFSSALTPFATSFSLQRQTSNSFHRQSHSPPASGSDSRPALLSYAGTPQESR